MQNPLVYCHLLAHTCIAGFQRTCSNPLLPLNFGTHVPNKIFVHFKKKINARSAEKCHKQWSNPAAVVGQVLKKAFCLTSNANIFQSVRSNVSKKFPHTPIQLQYKILRSKFQKKYFVSFYVECTENGSFGVFLRDNCLGPLGVNQEAGDEREAVDEGCAV